MSNETKPEEKTNDRNRLLDTVCGSPGNDLERSTPGVAVVLNGAISRQVLRHPYSFEQIAVRGDRPSNAIDSAMGQLGRCSVQ